MCRCLSSFRVFPAGAAAISERSSHSSRFTHSYPLFSTVSIFAASCRSSTRNPANRSGQGRCLRGGKPSLWPLSHPSISLPTKQLELLLGVGSEYRRDLHAYQWNGETLLLCANLLPAIRNHTMTMLKVQTWRPDTHPGHIVEVEWEYDREAGRDTGREHRGVSVLYPDGTHIHRDTHGQNVAHEHYQKLHAEHVVKTRAYNVIIESLPAHMKKPVLDSDGDPVLDNAGQPRLTVKDKH